MMNKLTLLIFSCLLTACSLFPEGREPLPLYTLKSEVYTPSEALKHSLAIDYPMSEASLDTPRIAVTPSPYQRDYLADGQWPDRLPKVVHTVLLESLSERWGGTYVTRASSGLQTKYILTSEIQDFSVYDLENGQPQAQLKILFRLVDFRNRKTLAAQIFSEKIPACSFSVNGIVTAFNQALNSLLLKAIPWMEEMFKEKKPSSLPRKTAS